MTVLADPPRRAPPRRLDELPDPTRALCLALAERLRVALPGRLQAIYAYGAMVFRETEHLGDLDAHVLLHAPLSQAEQHAVREVHRALTAAFPHVTDETLDIWYILGSEADLSAPRHQLDPTWVDTSWALHRAHLLAGYGIPLYGPAPRQILPAPRWQELSASLHAELAFIHDHIDTHPAYGVLNACRLMLSHHTRDVVFSKKASAHWAMRSFPAWKALIDRALDGEEVEGREAVSFVAFAEGIIAGSRRSPTGQVGEGVGGECGQGDGSAG